MAPQQDDGTGTQTDTHTASVVAPDSQPGDTPATATSKPSKRHDFRKNVDSFLAGPYFKAIPPAYERAVNAHFVRNGRKRSSQVGGVKLDRSQFAAGAKEFTDPKTNTTFPNFTKTIRELVRKDWHRVESQRSAKSAAAAAHCPHHHTDGPPYGVTAADLVPLPFDTPTVMAYLGDFAGLAFPTIQSTIVMFLAIMVENTDRRYKDKGNYDSSWLPLIKALVILYPLVTLVIMVINALEMIIKKLMYYRLLSMRILLDWQNVMLWQGTFFYYFILTWILLNCWAIYGLVAYRNQNGVSGPDPTSLSTFIVVNLQTMLLLIQYWRVLTAEKRLVSLNEIFERAPMEAQNLLRYTYVIEEDDLIEECYQFLHAHWRRALLRLANIMCLGFFFTRWQRGLTERIFDTDQLRDNASNKEMVEAAMDELVEQLLQEELRKDDQPASPELVKETVTHVQDDLLHRTSHAHGRHADAAKADDEAAPTAPEDVHAAVVSRKSDDGLSAAPGAAQPAELPVEEAAAQPAAAAAAGTRLADTAAQEAEAGGTVADPQQHPSAGTNGAQEAPAAAAAHVPAADGPQVVEAAAHAQGAGGKEQPAQPEAPPAVAAAPTAAGAGWQAAGTGGKEQQQAGPAAAGPQPTNGCEAQANSLQPADAGAHKDAIVAISTRPQGQDDDFAKLPKELPVLTFWMWVRMCLRRHWRAFWWAMYLKVYASIHSILVALLPGAQSWPFLPDVAYFRFFSAVQIIGIGCTGLIVLFGLKSATSSNPCSKGNKSCDQCLRYVDAYLVNTSALAQAISGKEDMRCTPTFNVSGGAFSVLRDILYSNRTWV